MNKNTQTFESQSFVKKYFPPDPITGHYILICVLYPNYNKSSEENEQIHLMADFDKGTAGENACWNVVHHCSYENVRDEATIQEKASKIEDPMEKKDFLLLDAQRIFNKNEYKMSVESIGIFSNHLLVYNSCEYILQCLRNMYSDIRDKEKDSEQIVSYDSNVINATSSNGALHQQIQNAVDSYFTVYKEDDFFVFKLKKDDYTIGKLVEYYFYEMYEKEVSFVGFKKKHPTEAEAYIYVKFVSKYKDEEVFNKMLILLDRLIQMYITLQNYFKES